MASNPNEPPESIIISQFTGLRNTASEERLGLGDLSKALNIDIDDTGQVRRRRGYTLKSVAAHHSLTDIAGMLHVVRDGTLGWLDAALGFNALGDGGAEPIAYTNVGSTIYYSSEDVSGKIVDRALQPWGQTGGAGEWLSPVLQPTETLGAISGRMLSRPPMATLLEHYKGRIYLGNGKTLWATELYLYDLVDRNRNFLQFPDELTMVRAVDDGLYVGTTAQLLFLRGTLSGGMSQQVVVDAPVIRGSDTLVPYSKAHPQARSGQPIPEGSGPMFMTATGICLGLDGGNVFNLTQDRMAFPQAERAAVLCRQDQGATNYLAVVDSAGGHSANARIGDYVDAEIIRASQRG